MKIKAPIYKRNLILIVFFLISITNYCQTVNDYIISKKIVNHIYRDLWPDNNKFKGKTLGMMKHPSQPKTYVFATGAISSMPETLMSSTGVDTIVKIIEFYIPGEIIEDIHFINNPAIDQNQDVLKLGKGLFEVGTDYYQYQLSGRKKIKKTTSANINLHSEMAMLSYLASYFSDTIVDDNLSNLRIVSEKPFCNRCYNYLKSNGCYLPTPEEIQETQTEYGLCQAYNAAQTWCVPNYQRSKPTEAELAEFADKPSVYAMDWGAGNNIGRMTARYLTSDFFLTNSEIQELADPISGTVRYGLQTFSTNTTGVPQAPNKPAD